MTEFFINIITWLKIRLMRSMSYMGIANSIMLIFVLLKIEDNLVLNKYKFLIAFLWFILLIFLGHIEILSRTPHKESQRMLELQPPFKFMYEKIREIDNRTIKIEKDINEVFRKSDGGRE